MNEDINRLLSRYMEGESTQEELRLLGEYLRQTDPLPDAMKPFARMYAMLDERPEVPTAKALDRFAEAAPSPRLPLVGRGVITFDSRKPTGVCSSPNKGEVGRGSGEAGKGLRRVLPLLAAACIAAIAFILLMPPKSDENLAIAYIDGKELADQTLAMQMGQEALTEIFSNGNQEQQLSELFNTP